YGLVLYKKPNTILRVAISVLLVTLIVDLGLNTWWLTMITGKAASVLIYPRLIKSAIMFPIQVSLISLIWKYTYSHIKVSFAHKA
ncbi:MAG: folate transporter, partial [Clostridium sp.]